MFFIGGPALAAPPQTDTRTEKNVVETFRDVIPTCEHAVAPTHRITTTSNLVEHSTLFGDGREHFTFKQTGTFIARPLGGGVTYTGRFTVSGTFNDNGRSTTGTFTFTVRGTGSDGSRFVTHFTDHFNTTPTGAEFFFSRCHD
jgi:hypothetical protein